MDTLTFVILALLLYVANMVLVFATYDLLNQESKKTIYITSVAALWCIIIGAWCMLFVYHVPTDLFKITIVLKSGV